MGDVSVAVGSKTPAGVAGFAWTRWQLCHGSSGNFRVERVAALLWNQWQLWRGIRSIHSTPTPCSAKAAALACALTARSMTQRVLPVASSTC